MDHPARTLLYELFVEPILRLLQRPFWTKGQCPTDEKRCEDGGMKDDRYQSSNPTQTSNCRRQLLRNNGSL